MRPAQVWKYCALDDACQSLKKTAMRQLQLTARAYHLVLKLSRTIADLAGSGFSVCSSFSLSPGTMIWSRVTFFLRQRILL
jgi:predicted ATPase with chaperone activity